ncbi:hypothetical protein D3C74_444460 [compost metagenome]
MMIDFPLDKPFFEYSQGDFPELFLSLLARSHQCIGGFGRAETKPMEKFGYPF